MKILEVKTQTKVIDLTHSGDYLVWMSNYSGKITINLKKEKSIVYVLGCYNGKNTDQYQLMTEINHLHSNTKSQILIKGIFDGKASFTFTGKVNIDEKAKQSVAMLQNHNLILSNEAKVQASPQLSIQNNEVNCQHRFTTGEISEPELLYLYNRGLSKPQAERLLQHGFMNSINKLLEQLPLTKSQIKKYQTKVKEMVQ